MKYKMFHVSLICDLCATEESHERQKPVFLINHELWTRNRVKAWELSTSDHILFPKELLYFGSIGTKR